MISRLQLCIMLLAAGQLARAQSDEQMLNREFTFAGKSTPVIIVANISGSIKVNSHDGTVAKVTVHKVVKGASSGQITVGNIELGDTLILYTGGICASFGRTGGNHSKNFAGWGYNWQPCKQDNGWLDNDDFEYELNYELSVPANSSVLLSTVNEGDIDVSGVKGRVVATNVNGSISLRQLAGQVKAHTVNGDVDLAFDTNPSEDSRFYTLNGDIHADFVPGLKADLSFKSFNGDLYTNVDDVRELAPRLEEVPSESGIKFKVDGSRYKIREGGMLLDFETFNGNVYLNEKKN